jgi:transposase
LKTVSDVKDVILEESVIHVDETGVHVDKNMLGTTLLAQKTSHFSALKKRGKKGMDAAGILPNYVDTGIHDCWSPYFKYLRIRHGLCFSHGFRELPAVIENFHQEWAQKLIDLLLEMSNTSQVHHEN